jgi:hypothetical protein
LALVVAAALLAGLVPAISSTGKELLSGLRDSSRTVGGSASRARLRKAMLTAEIALTAVLLISAGLPRGRSIRRRFGGRSDDACGRRSAGLLDSGVESVTHRSNSGITN